ncbi:MAG: asparagine synthase (glutamine-hydrolyzing) [Verrucomicrobia bacterium]|nr:asparagine synthase (glutamine-hydrolyzing) [Verrucomicrobiota bacterium]
MCGIAGFIGKGDRPLLERMCQSISHRGPDEDGVFIAPGIGLGMRRLSIIDLAGGHQPISNEDGTVVVVFNGEIYNYEELTASLKSHGHLFKTNSDTETIVHLYEDHGLKFVEHLRGMFAIALWDTRKRRLVLVRDRIGEKPLFYQYDEDDGSLLFGSEIKAILQRGDGRHVHAQALCQFMAAGYVPAPNTFYRGIQKVPPACMIVHENHKVEIHRYWNREHGSRQTISFKDACSELSDLLVDSVRLCLKSDVEVGSFLSGGLDSSVITGIMRQLGAEVQTFSVGYQGAAVGFNELSYARRVADTLVTKHHELILQPDSTIELLPRILWHFDEPHGEPSSVLVFLLSAFTRKQVKVAMGGTGGDEIFYGYPKHAGLRMLEYYRLLPRFVRVGMLEHVIMKWPESTKGNRFAKRAKRFVTGASLPAEEAYLSWTSLLNRDLRDHLLSTEIRDHSADPSGEEFLRSFLTAPGRGSLLDRVTDMEVTGYLPEYQLTYIDRMSMAAGLEARSPLCDWRLVDYVTSLPDGYRLKGARSKHIFKAIATQWIPKEIAERKKVGFDSPIGQWIKDELRGFMSSFLSPEQIKKTGLFNPAAVQQLLAAHLAGQNDYSLQLWSLLSVEAWHRMFIEDNISEISGYSLQNIRGAGNS